MQNILLFGDCLELMFTLPPHSIDAIIADLPYGTTGCAWDEVIPLKELWQAYKHVAKPHAPIILCAGQPFTSALISSNYRMFKYCWYWEKEKGTGFLNAKRQPLRKVEEICVFYKKQCLYRPQMVELDRPYRHTLPNKATAIHAGKVATSGVQERQYVEYTHAYPFNVLRFPRDKANKSLVPTQKPLALMDYLVRTYTQEGDVVLDNCMGSGTTCLSAKKLGRRYVGMEIDKKHFEIAKERLDVC